MPETDIHIRYGFICEKKAEVLPGDSKKNSFVLRVFEEEEDWQWRNGVLMSRAKRAGRSFRSLCTDGLMAEIDSLAAKAREDGKVPLRVAGPSQDVPEFMVKIGVEPGDLMI